MERYATVIWNGSGKDGSGLITTQSAALKEIPYSFKSRFVSVDGTNPEELLAAAHASCFIMKLNFVLEAADFIPKTIETTVYIKFERGQITSLRLVVKANVPGISYEKFDENVKEAAVSCPISQVLNVNISTESILQNNTYIH